MAQERNNIKIGFNTRIGSVITYSNALIEKEGVKTLNFSAIGGAIGNAICPYNDNTIKL